VSPRAGGGAKPQANDQSVTQVISFRTTVVGSVQPRGEAQLTLGHSSRSTTALWSGKPDRDKPPGTCRAIGRWLESERPAGDGRAASGKHGWRCGGGDRIRHGSIRSCGSPRGWPTSRVRGTGGAWLVSPGRTASPHLDDPHRGMKDALHRTLIPLLDSPSHVQVCRCCELCLEAHRMLKQRHLRVRRELTSDREFAFPNPG
jgi:hypothetical protein